MVTVKIPAVLLLLLVMMGVLSVKDEEEMGHRRLNARVRGRVGVGLEGGVGRGVGVGAVEVGDG